MPGLVSKIKALNRNQLKRWFETSYLHCEHIFAPKDQVFSMISSNCYYIEIDFLQIIFTDVTFWAPDISSRSGFSFSSFQFLHQND